MTQIDIAQVGRQALGKAPDESMPNVCHARNRDDDGKPIVDGEPIRLMGMDWLVPRRKSAVRIDVSESGVTCEDAELDEAEAVLIEAVLDGADIYSDSVRVGPESCYRLLAHALRINYSLPDAALSDILNDDIEVTNQAVRAVLDIRLVLDEKSHLVYTLMEWARAFAGDNPMKVAETMAEHKEQCDVDS